MIAIGCALVAVLAAASPITAQFDRPATESSAEVLLCVGAALAFGTAVLGSTWARRRTSVG
ncbi:hypothetical protein [Leucobacter sp. NPDC077196]|uniref:hypothetical protein n=1 Tax=Leucobacter sp. NPDC077196 TaxID=3154959 RepID=UPI003427B979